MNLAGTPPPEISTDPRFDANIAVNARSRPSFTPNLQDLRHSFASHAVLQGVPLPVVSRLLGHKQPSMTLRYAHVSDSETEAAAERIGAAIAQSLEE